MLLLWRQLGLMAIHQANLVRNLHHRLHRQSWDYSLPVAIHEPSSTIAGAVAVM
jgi:hypothetical protein